MPVEPGTTIAAGAIAVPGGMPGGGRAAAALIVGMMVDWPASRIPDGWLVAAGQAVSRQVYAQLFEWYGTTYGAGDGVTTFNLPDARGRTTVGLDVDTNGYAQRVTVGISGVDSAQLASVGGNERYHVHTHGVYDPTHAHGATDHEHGHHDPTHAHTMAAHEHVVPNHQHGLWDPSHAHGVADGGHDHVGASSDWYEWAFAGNIVDGGTTVFQWGGWGLTISAENVNIGIYGAGLGALADWGGYMWNDPGTGGVGSYGSGTGTWSDWRGTGIYGAYTGISIYNEGGGLSQNAQPALVIQKIIYTGVFVRPEPNGG